MLKVQNNTPTSRMPATIRIVQLSTPACTMDMQVVYAISLSPAHCRGFPGPPLRYSMVKIAHAIETEYRKSGILLSPLVWGEMPEHRENSAVSGNFSIFKKVTRCRAEIRSLQDHCTSLSCNNTTLQKILDRRQPKHEGLHMNKLDLGQKRHNYTIIWALDYLQ
jgi:hypothetical protein